GQLANAVGAGIKSMGETLRGFLRQKSAKR
ncbi:hypothetical protein NO2_1537, partial [Candidatus Termititenax persephonae]